MSSGTSIFNVNHIKILNNNTLHLIQIKEFNPNIELKIDELIVKVCEGNSGNTVKNVKTRILQFLETKRGTNTEMGAIAEFITHIYLNEYGFRQECMYFNLEEGSIKKGFDGYYSKDKEEWIYESKSGSIKTKRISHHLKIKEAYDDLEAKIKGSVSNNPWRNALNHAGHIDITNGNGTLLQSLRSLSNNFINKVFPDIKDFNIIPGSTIFLEGSWIDMDILKIRTDIENTCKVFKCRKMNIICIHKNSIDLLWDYLKK